VRLSTALASLATDNYANLQYVEDTTTEAATKDYLPNTYLERKGKTSIWRDKLARRHPRKMISVIISGCK
jgi:hypothetical protein